MEERDMGIFDSMIDSMIWQYDWEYDWPACLKDKWT